MLELAKEESPETDSSPPSSSHCCTCTLCHAPGKKFSTRRRRRHTNNDHLRSSLTSVQKKSLCGLPALTLREMTEQTDNKNALIYKDYHNLKSLLKTKTIFKRFSHLLLLGSNSLIILFLISSFLISISTCSEVSQQQLGNGNNINNSNFDATTNYNNNLANNGGNASARNINSGIFPNNNFGGGSTVSGISSSPSTPSAGGGGGNNNGNNGAQFVAPSINNNPPTDSSNSKPTAYFIAGLASQIRKINSTAVMLLTRDKPFQLQFRTICPFGNIVYDDKFSISINSGGNMTYTTKPNEFPSSISHHTVADGRWHSITFSGARISLDDHDLDLYPEENPVIAPVVHWDTNTSAETDHTTKLSHTLHFFDGFVGCIRVKAPTHDHGRRKQQNIQSEESYLTPESPFEHQIVSLYDLFQLRTPFVPCNDSEVELTSVHSCFNPDTFVLCNKCQNDATCLSEQTDNPMNNQCECLPNTEEVEYSGKYCETTGHEEYARESLPEVENAPELGESDAGGMPISSPSNIDSLSANSTMMDSNSEGRVALTFANVVEPISTTTTTAPPELPFTLEPGANTCPCLNGGDCLASDVHEGQFICNCTGTGYEGVYCDIDIDECKKFKNVCNNGICQNIESTFECYCKPGWAGKRCDKNILECLSHPCLNNGTCHDLIDDYRCECQAGFTGHDCSHEINECESNPCQNQGICEDRLNDYFCNCIVPGYEGKSCEIDKDECEFEPCLHGSKCIDQVNGFFCDCNDTGFEGDICQHNIEDCLPNSCKNNATCVDQVNGFICECFNGFIGNDCSTDIDECAEVPCHSGKCFQKSNQSLYSPDIDDRIRELLPYQFHYDTAAGYVCLCDAGYEDVNCTTNIDECALEVIPCGKNGNCKDEVNSYKCECHPGYSGERCQQEINECESSPCVRGECVDRVGDYICRCPESYGAKNCGVLLTGCIRDPCNNLAKCFAFYDEATNNHTFECECKEGFTGKTCSLNTVMSFNGSGPVEITANDRHYDNGNYELLFKFRTTLPDVLLIVGSGITYFYLTLSGGKLNLQSSLLNSLEGISVGQNLSNSELHKVWISVNSTHIALAADSQQTFYPIQTEDVHTGFNVTYIGGGMTNAFVNSPTKKVIKSQFIGCMQDIIINGENERVIPDYLNSSNIENGCKRIDQCKPPNSPCLNFGTCTDLWSKFICQCIRPYLGKTCQHEYIAATFQHESVNNSLSSVEISSDIGNKFVSTFDISMFVRTRKRNGTIFLLGHEINGNYSVFLEAEVGEVGNLVVHAKWSDVLEDPNSKIETYPVDGLQITDGSQHLVSIQREKGLVKISVNGTEHFRKSVGTRITFHPTILYIGGKPLLPDVASNQLESRIGRTLTINEETEEGEDSTATPESVMTLSQVVVPESKEAVTEEVHESNNEISVIKPFKGVIQDVRVNFSSNEAVPMGIGHLQQMAKTQNHYVVEFYPLEINSTYAMGEPLGLVEKQNLLRGVVSDDACKINRCLNSGICVTTFNDFKCICTSGYDGRLCDFKLPCAIMTCPDKSVCHNIGWKGFECVSDVSFQGDGAVSPHYHLVSNELENVTFTEISFRFRSKSPGNVLYIANGSQSFRVGFEEEFDAQNQSAQAIAVYINGQRHSTKLTNILDGRWRNVSMNLAISEQSGTLRLRVDSSEQNLVPPVESALDFLSDLIKSPNAEIVVGSHVEHRDRYNIEHSEMHENHVGHPEDAHGQFYRGCLSDIKFGEYRLPFVSPAQLTDINENTTLAKTTAPTAFYIEESSVHNKNLHLGCIVCYERECMNQGRCANKMEDFDCTCPKGFENSRCSKNIDECIDNDCRNGGICVDAIANYTCDCVPGYEGWKCDVDVDECSPKDDNYPICQNMGVCTDKVNGFECQCTDEFLGKSCEIRRKSSCRDVPCENGACYDKPQTFPNDVTFECECQAGWEGETCSSKVDYCKNIRCSNNGTCHNKPLGFECICQPGYDGPQCTVNIDECLSQPCFNNGTCIDFVNEFKCHCQHTGYTGLVCSEDVNECSFPHMCPPAQTCHNLPGSYSCLCPDDSMCGEHCDILNPCYNKTCLNGGECKSNCLDQYNTDWVCECISGYRGEFCDLLTMAYGGQPLDILLIIIPVIAALLIAATVAVVILVRMARKKRATRGVYSPSQQEYCNPRVELDNVMKPPPEERLI